MFFLLEFSTSPESAAEVFKQTVNFATQALEGPPGLR